MSLGSLTLEYSIRSMVKPYLRRVPLNARGVRRLRTLAETAFSFLKPPMSTVYLQQTVIAGVRVEEITPRSSVIKGTLLYCPGGGYLCCSPKTHRNLTVRLASLCRLRLIVLDYTKVPEGEPLDALVQAIDVYKHVLKNYVRGATASHPIFFAGDSAGGHLALTATLEAHRLGLPIPRGLVCLSPWTDMSCPQEGRFYDSWDPLIPITTLEQVAKRCLHGASPYDERFSPVYANLACLPPMLVQAVANEVLYHDSTRLVARAQEAGVAAHLSSWLNVPHCFQLLAPYMSQAVAALDEIEYFVSYHIHHGLQH